MDNDAILALVTRLARPHPSGGQVIERSAILAAGANSPAVIDWILDHAGTPESTTATPSRGLHGARLTGTPEAPQAPQRFVLPAGVL